MRGKSEIARLGREDLSRAAEILARAFRDNPLNVAVIGDGDPERRLRSNTHGMRSLLPVALGHAVVLGARGDAGLAGVLIAAPPFAYPLPPPPLSRRLRCLLGQGWHVARRWAEVFAALDALHPADPHWYLGTLGVDPCAQHRGVGAALLDRWLALAEPDAVPAYLETDRPENLPFYARRGFEVAGELVVLGARTWRMRRPPPPRAR